MKAQVTAASQTHKLRERMEEANVRHGQEVRADIPNVRVMVAAHGGSEIFFCNTGPIRVKRTFTPGDQDPLPSNVVVEGLEFPHPGEYDIADAWISANGAITIATDSETRVRCRSRFTNRLFRGAVFAM